VWGVVGVGGDVEVGRGRWKVRGGGGGERKVWKSWGYGEG